MRNETRQFKHQIPNSPFAGVVGVGDSSELLKLGLELGVGDTLVDSVDKELAALLSVGGHDDRNVGSLSLSQAKQVRRRGSRVSLQQYQPDNKFLNSA